jgi:regulatory protein
LSSSPPASGADARDTAQELRARALRLLARREHSCAELSRKLAPHAGSAADLEGVIDFLLARKSLSDERYAEARAHQLARRFGAAKIRQDLKAKGVADDIVARVSSEGEIGRAKAILERKFKLPSASREEYARRARFLQGRGFSYDVIRSALSSPQDD